MLCSNAITGHGTLYANGLALNPTVTAGAIHYIRLIQILLCFDPLALLQHLVPTNSLKMSKGRPEGI